MTLEIAYLDEHVDAIPALATWHHQAWSAVTPHLTVADRIAGFHARARRGSIPTGFVALADSVVVGMACLVAHDVDSHRHLTPWLASVLVAPAHRGQGIGSVLSRRTTEEAAVLGTPHVYLFTYDKQAFYTRLGWSTLEPAEMAGVAGTVMDIVQPGQARRV
ncbi:MAG TPA: GNAT family N-acetyltransferase [Vicinamibacterales bacterium]